MHKYLQEQAAKERGVQVTIGEPRLPMLKTAVEDIDVSVEMAGVKFPNPFGLASAPPCTSGLFLRSIRLSEKNIVWMISKVKYKYIYIYIYLT